MLTLYRLSKIKNTILIVPQPRLRFFHTQKVKKNIRN